MASSNDIPPDAGAASIEKDFSAVSDTFGSAIEDPHSLYRELRQTSPVMEGDILARFDVPSQADYANKGRQVYTLFKYEDVTAVLKDPQTYSSGLLNEGIGQFLGGFMLTGMSNERHKMARALLAPAFSPAVIARWRETVKSVVREEVIAPLAPAGKADLIRDVLLPAPVRLIYAILGFPEDRDQIEQFAAWGMRILVGPQRDPEKAKKTMEAATRASTDIHEHVMALTQQRRREGAEGNGLLDYLIHANYDGRTLTDDEISSFVRQLLPAASETTTRSFGSMLVALLRDPELLARVRADRSLVAKVIDEGMRWETASQFLARQCERDVEIRGVKIPRGAALSLASGSANRDEDVFENPDTFDIDRPKKPHLGFGFGAHLCLGMGVARMEMEIMLNTMLDAWPNLRLDPAAPEPKIVGVQLRGPREIPVVWD